MSGTAWNWNPESITAIATASLAVFTLVLLIGVVFAAKQLRATYKEIDAMYEQWKAEELSRKAGILFELTQQYSKPAFRAAVKVLFSQEYKDFQGFKQCFSGEDYKEADDARRAVKCHFSVLGYILKYGILDPNDLFPLTPTAIEVWERLFQVEHDMIDERGDWDPYNKGWDEVRLVDEFFVKYYCCLGRENKIPGALSQRIQSLQNREGV